METQGDKDGKIPVRPLPDIPADGSVELDTDPGDPAVGSQLVKPTGKIVPLDTGRLPSAAEIRADVKARIDIIDAVKSMVFYALKPGDVVNYGGKPYIRGFGSGRIRAAAKISLTGLRMEGPLWSEDRLGPIFFFRCYGTLSHPYLSSVQSVGTCSSRAKFHAQRTDRNDPTGNTKYFLPPEDVNMGNVERHALTEMVRKGIEALLGLQGTTWNDLKPFGFRPDNCEKVSFREGGQSDAKQYQGRYKTAGPTGGSGTGASSTAGQRPGTGAGSGQPGAGTGTGQPAGRTTAGGPGRPTGGSPGTHPGGRTAAGPGTPTGTAGKPAQREPGDDLPDGFIGPNGEVI